MNTMKKKKILIVPYLSFSPSQKTGVKLIAWLEFALSCQIQVLSTELSGVSVIVCRSSDISSISKWYHCQPHYHCHRYDPFLACSPGPSSREFSLCSSWIRWLWLSLCKWNELIRLHLLCFINRYLHFVTPYSAWTRWTSGLISPWWLCTLLWSLLCPGF